MSGPNIARIDQSKLRENVYDALSSAFTRGQFAPGDVVNLRTLADQLGTSMTPVREAVRRLVAEGALIDTPSRTLMVPEFDVKRMEDMKQARIALESLVVDQTFDNVGAADITVLEDILATSSGTVESGVDLQQNYDFHFTLYRFSKSDVLLPLIQALWLQYGAYLNRIIQQEASGLVEENKYHDMIIDGLKRADRKAVQAALVADIERSFKLLFEAPVGTGNT